MDDGSKTYAYDAANRLISVETADATSALAYNGLGQRMSMSAAGVTTQYVMNGNQLLIADADGSATHYLYGLGAIAEETDAWSYSLPDGASTPRQLADASANITLSARYTPWGDTMETYGDGGFTFGYFGGVMDATTGLLYVGNGQYYDPYTGRFLTRDAKPENSNPYLPFDPISALFAPLGLLSLYYSRKKNSGKLGMWLVLLIVIGSVGMGLSACFQFENDTGAATDASATVTITPTGTHVNFDLGGATLTPVPPGTSMPPIEILTTPCPTPTPILTMTMLTSGYYIPTESQAKKYDGGLPYPIPANPGGEYANKLYLINYGERTANLEYTNYQAGSPAPQFAYEGLIYDYSYTCLQGSAKLDISGGGHYISCNTSYTWSGFLLDDPEHTRESLPIAYRWADEDLITSLVPYHSVAVCDETLRGRTIQLLGLPDQAMDKLAIHGNPNAEFTIRDTGEQLCAENNVEGKEYVDVFTGEGKAAYSDTNYFTKKEVDVIIR